MLYWNGMTLRDWFAGQALASGGSAPSNDGTATWCYEMADAMIKAREITNSEGNAPTDS